MGNVVRIVGYVFAAIGGIILALFLLFFFTNGFFAFINYLSSQVPWAWYVIGSGAGSLVLGGILIFVGSLLDDYCCSYRYYRISRRGYSGSSYSSSRYESSSSDYDSSENSYDGYESSNNGLEPVPTENYYSEGRRIGYKIGDRYYDSDGNSAGYDVGDRHYDSDGNSAGYRVGDREYDSDGNSLGYWIGDTFYSDD